MESAPHNTCLTPLIFNCLCCFAALQSHTHFVLFDDVGKLSGPDEAVMRRDEQEAIAAVEGGRSGLHQPGLDVPSAWCCTGMEKKQHTDRWLIAESSDYHYQHAWIIKLEVLGQ